MIANPRLLLTLALALPLLHEQAQAACHFGDMNQTSPFGQSLAPHLKRLGPSGYSRLPGEDGWSVEPREFAGLQIRAPLADYVWVGTYNARVFKFNLRFPTRQLKARKRDLARELDACATRVADECWQDDAGIFLELGNDSHDTYLYTTAPQYGSPKDPDLPPHSCRSPGEQQAWQEQQKLKEQEQEQQALQESQDPADPDTAEVTAP